MSDFDDVGKFHERFGLPRAGGSEPQLISDEEITFRLKFLHEELEELEAGYQEQNLVKIADALVDLVYVALGTAHFHQLPWKALFAEVQRANMTKERCELDHPFFICHECKGAGFLSDAMNLSEPCSSCSGAGRCAECDLPADKHSQRGSSLDIIKPRGWRPPAVARVLAEHGWNGPLLPFEEV